MKKSKFQARQGDVYVEAVDEKEVPKDLKPVAAVPGKGVVLAYGEVTGHAHAIADEEVELFEDSAGTMWLKVKNDQGATLKHEEHAKIPLKKGVYRVRHQVEHFPTEERRVVD